MSTSPTPKNPSSQCLKAADETKAAYAESKEDALADRKLFVSNLIWLLMQTREGILGGYLDDHEIVHILYSHDYAEQKINIHMDSYFAIIKDIVNHLE